MEMMIKKDDHIQYFQNSYNHITIGFSYNWQPVRIQGLVLDELKKNAETQTPFASLQSVFSIPGKHGSTMFSFLASGWVV